MLRWMSVRVCSLVIVQALLSLQGVCQPTTVKEAMDGIVTRLYATMNEEQLHTLDDSAIQAFITAEERQVLATRYLYFEVNVPVVVSVMREKKQAKPPYWLSEAGFKKAGLVVTNIENWEYEVWQKEFDAGHVGLGINGFDNHRPHYFAAVGPQNAGDRVEITDLSPSEFSVGWMHEGAFTYHDWDSLLLKDVPREMIGHRLLTTIRGRAREANLIGGFRKTPHPSSEQPDQVILTWSEDPRTTQTIQWRTSTAVKEGVVRYKKEGTPSYSEMEAEDVAIEDRLLMNDRYCHHFTATLRGLEPGTGYEYMVGSPQANTWSGEAKFLTAPDGPEPFSFTWFGDTHKREEWGVLIEKAQARHPQSAFFGIAGDLVSTGQYRDDWDELFHLSRNVLNQRPLVPTIGNHDCIDGLGAGMYRSLLGLPMNGPRYLEPERAYSFEYGNALFLIPDSGLPVMDQAEWIEDRLANTKAMWKFAMFHFPPYSHGEPYPEIRSLWGYLFDKYHLDFAFEGHVHYYMRSHPIRRGQPVASPAEGTIHVISIAIPGREHDLPPADYAAVQLSGVQLYQTVEIDGNRLVYRAHDMDGTVRDEVVIEK